MATDDLSPTLPDIANDGDERLMLRQFLDYYRAVLERKTSGLDGDQLNIAIEPSNLTLGGLLLHMAGVEEGWFSENFLDRPLGEPWIGIDWHATPDWELDNAHTFTPEEIGGYFRRACQLARTIEKDAQSLDQRSAKTHPSGTSFTLRWIMIHMIEEYARHCGHADFIRQAIDGTVGD